MKTNEPVAAIRGWVERAVVAENLCPFARPVIRSGGLDIRSSEAIGPEAAAEDVVVAASEMRRTGAPDTLILVFPTGLDDFDDFLDAVDLATALLEQMGLSTDLQLAHFHPEYCFEGEEAESAGNYTNRSPLPAVHLLRTADVARAVAAHPDTAGIPEANIARLEAMTAEARHRLQYGE